jgi:hypothetical protein
MAWLKIPLSGARDGRQIEDSLAQKVLERVKEGAFQARDIEYIAKLPLPITGETIHVDEVDLKMLRRLCSLWEVDVKASQISSHRKFIGPVIVAAKKALIPVLRMVLKDTFQQQREFNAQAILLLTRLAHGQKTSEQSPLGT